MRKQWALFYALLFMLAGHAKAQETPPLMPLEEQEAMENLSRAFDTLAKVVIKGTADKKTQCMKAIGNPEFCECIGEKSPVGVTFMQYVVITAGTKEDFKYDQLSTEDKEIFDATRAARDKCVNWKGKGTDGAKN